MADIQPTKPSTPTAPKPSVSLEQAVASLVEAHLLGGGDGGAAAAQWYNDRKAKSANG